MSRCRFPAWIGGAIGWAAGGSASAQVLTHASDVDISYGRVAAALVLCLALAAGAALALRSRIAGGKKPPSMRDWLGWNIGGRLVAQTRQLELVERLRISPQLEVSLLLCQGRRYLVASSATGTVLLDKDIPDEPLGDGEP